MRANSSLSSLTGSVLGSISACINIVTTIYLIVKFFSIEPVIPWWVPFVFLATLATFFVPRKMLIYRYKARAFTKGFRKFFTSIQLNFGIFAIIATWMALIVFLVSQLFAARDLPPLASGLVRLLVSVVAALIINVGSAYVVDKEKTKEKTKLFLKITFG